MRLTKTHNGVTFAVDDVQPKTTSPSKTVEVHQAIAGLIGSKPEACHRYYDPVLDGVKSHPLAEAVYRAFSTHLPLVISPDMMWIAITQGVSLHILNHAESLRQSFVKHTGKISLVVKRNDFLRGSPDNQWPEFFEQLSSEVARHVPSDLTDFFVAKFSTTGPVERAVSQIVMLEAFQNYFDYTLSCICGIPEITLEGTSEDWQTIRARVDRLNDFDMPWWCKRLQPILDEFVKAFDGQIDLPHWQRICKVRSAYGGEVINGWIAAFFPYLQDFTGACVTRNTLAERDDPEGGLRLDQFPPGLSLAPFTEHYDGRPKRAMQIVGGFVGIEQDQTDLGLKPALGWAVREAPLMDQVMVRMTDYSTTPADPERVDKTLMRMMFGAPSDLIRFYRTFGSAKIGGRWHPTYNLIPIWETRSLRLPSSDLLLHTVNCEATKVAEIDRKWGAYLVYCEDNGSCKWEVLLGPFEEGELHKQRSLPVIASSFGEFLEKALQSPNKPFHLRRGFEPIRLFRL